MRREQTRVQAMRSSKRGIVNKAKYSKQKKIQRTKERYRGMKITKNIEIKLLKKGEHDVFLYFHYAKK